MRAVVTIAVALASAALAPTATLAQTTDEQDENQVIELEPPRKRKGKPKPCKPGEPCVCGRKVESRLKRTALHAKYLFYTCDDKMAWFPTIAVRPEYGTDYGLRLFHKDMFGQREAVVLNMRFGGRFAQAYGISIGLPKLGGGRYYAVTQFSFTDEGNLLFRGLGNPPDVTGGTGLDPREAAVDTRFKKTQLRALFGFGHNFVGDKLRVGPVVLFNRQRFAELSPDSPDTSIQNVYDVTKLPGWVTGSDVLQLLAEVSFDWRDKRTIFGHGPHGRVFFGSAPPIISRFDFWRFGIEAFYRYRFKRHNVITAGITHEAFLGEQDNIPFASAPRLGGVALLRGYAAGTFRDTMAVVGLLQYLFPLYGDRIAGSVFVNAGKVGNRYRRLIGPGILDDWQLGYGAGILFRITDDIRFRLSATRGDNFQISFISNLASFSRGRGYFP